MSRDKTDEVVEHLRRNGGRAKLWFGEFRDPKPLDASALSSLTLPDGRPLPPSLSTWLAYDATWFGLLPGSPPRLAAKPLRDILMDWAIASARAMPEGYEDPYPMTNEQVVESWIELLPDPAMADALAIELPGGDQDHILLFHRAHRDGEYPILGCHKRFEFWFKYESFGDFLAHYFGLTDPA
ncbi:hypothetical protein [Polyangium jinanense]|uniref:Uncharacterized protein n=1 Tax=Polyangium jinanense TaxID=2829994 RepID=A0A9X3X4L6_9BACT|nr:hypothetical protein [Polyangium jinanense]MDC3955517.1 hypothetical protein [Polyangium jinanense]MDC3982153.1 hypothetical protein [Polyangium jinanense]